MGSGFRQVSWSIGRKADNPVELALQSVSWSNRRVVLCVLCPLRLPFFKKSCSLLPGFFQSCELFSIKEEIGVITSYLFAVSVYVYRGPLF